MPCDISLRHADFFKEIQHLSHDNARKSSAGNRTFVYRSFFLKKIVAKFDKGSSGIRARGVHV